MHIWIYCFAICLLFGKGAIGQSTEPCDRGAFNQCFHDLITTATLAVNRSASDRACSETNFTSLHECATTHLEGCSPHFGHVMVSTLRPYIRLFDTIYQTACTGGYEYGDCDLATAQTCMSEYFQTLSSGGIARTCKQAALTQQCLQPVLDTCSDLSRYLVAMVMDEVKLTSDLLCHPDSCNLDIAGQLLREAMMVVDYPATIVRHSSLVCSEVWTTLALVTNQTAECPQDEIPPGLWQSYRLLYQFVQDYCPASATSAEDYLLTGIPADLLMPVYFATMATSQWTSRENMCRLFNTTLVQAAAHSQHTNMLPGYTEHLLTWRVTMAMTLDKYADACLGDRMFDCDWVERVAGSGGTCDVGAAEVCLDTTLLSLLVVEVNVGRSSWETVCVAAYNMLACHQYHLASCRFISVPSFDAVQEIDQLVGYECSQLGQFDRPESCDRPQPPCKVSEAIGECEALAHSYDDICQHTNEIFECFREKTSGCNSAQAATAQFYLEWFLRDCGNNNDEDGNHGNHGNNNNSILAEDSFRGLSQCRVQQGYNINDGLFMSADLGWILCAAGSLFDQCMSDKLVPTIGLLYGNQYSGFTSQFNQVMCNMTIINNFALPQGFTEAPECEIDTIAGEIPLVIGMLNDLPFYSVNDQTRVCGIVPYWMTTVSERMVNCSRQRESMLSDLFVYLDNAHAYYCPAARVSGDSDSCNVNRAQACLEDFGRYTYFHGSDADHCGELEETYTCLYESARLCDNATQDTILRDVRAIRGLTGGLGCPAPNWCGGSQPGVDSTIVQEMCAPQDICRMSKWQECVDQFGVNQFCSNASEVVSCIQNKLSGCDAPQYLRERYNIGRYISTLQSQFGFCSFGMAYPTYVTQTYMDMLQCSILFDSSNVFKENICFSINSYIQCVAALDHSNIGHVWKSVLEANVQMWVKQYYLSCQLDTESSFFVSPDFDRNNFSSSACNQQGVTCLQSLLGKAVTLFHVLPLDQRQTQFCDSVEEDATCVIEQTSGCEEMNRRTLVTSAAWLDGAIDNIGACSAARASWSRACDPEAALHCLADLGVDLAKSSSNRAADMACLKALSVQRCVNQHTSSCDVTTRSSIERTFSQVETIVRRHCTPQTPAASTGDACAASLGASAQCDLERGLVCLVPTQALMMQQNAGLDQVCSSIPAMKTCIQLYTSGCDQATRDLFTRRQLQLSARLNHGCPQMFCEECQARICLQNLHQRLQYEDVHICSAISETKQCIHDNAEYCDESVGMGMMRELELLVGEDSRLCEITLPSCLNKFMLSAMQIMSYTTPSSTSYPSYQNMTNNYNNNGDYNNNNNMNNNNMNNNNMNNNNNNNMAPRMPGSGLAYLYEHSLASMCEEATTAYYCLEHHLTSMNDSRQQVLVQTLTRIGEVVYDKCQGPQLQCYSCVNATSNEECNNQPPQSCPANMQACGTVVFNNYYLSKGCVSPDVCQSGCYGNTCAYCCHGDHCNQPWNSVIEEPATCQPLSSLWCGLQLLNTATQNVTNQTDTCSSLRDSISCMIDSTQACRSHNSAMMGSLGRQLLTIDTLAGCLGANPACTCGQCTSMLLLTVASGPYPNVEQFCSSVSQLYSQSVDEMDFQQCDQATLHSTAYNLNNAVYMLQGVCDLSFDESDCVFNNTVYKHGTSTKDLDGCNTCRCNDGKFACTKMFCPPKNLDSCPPVEFGSGGFGICGYMCRVNDECPGNQVCCTTPCGGTSCTDPQPKNDTKCYYNGQMYNSGESFPTADGCNICVCTEMAITCSNFSCPAPENFTANATCDLGAAQNCIQDASGNYQLLLDLGFGIDAVCNEAASMLRCIEPRVSSCPMYVLESVREAISGNLNLLNDTCDIPEILQQYAIAGGAGGGANLTAGRPCAIVKGLECFSAVGQNDTCRQYQDVVECVSNYTTGCYAMNMAPVLFALERELELLAEDCDIVVPGPASPTPAPTRAPTTARPPTNRNYCSYNNKTWSAGSTFRAIDDYNFCFCDQGDTVCTELVMPYQGDTRTCNMTGVEQCIQNSYMAYMVSMATQDGGWQICMSAAQMLHCVEAQTRTCPQNVATTVHNIVLYHLNQASAACSFDQIMMAYAQIGSQPGNGDGTSTGDGYGTGGGSTDVCTMQGVRTCLWGAGDSEDLCSTQQSSLECMYNLSRVCYSGDASYTLRMVKQFLEGSSGCQLNMPPRKDEEHCYYDNQVFNVGDNFVAMDGCNFCFCGNNGNVGCTKMYCGDPALHNATCDISGVYECMQQAAIPHLVSIGASETRHICLSAAEMLRCVEPKVGACPSDVFQLVHAAVWSDLALASQYCNLDQLYWLYNNNNNQTGPWEGNMTMPDTSKTCALEEAAKCVRIKDGDTACSAYQSMIDCVYDFTAGCMSVDAVPVLYELQRHLGPASALCDLVTPLMQLDAAYPVAQCTLLFAEALGNSLTVDYLISGQLDSMCANVDGYLTCLGTADLSVLGRAYATNAKRSVANLIDMCDRYKQDQVENVVECHSCLGLTSMEECDSRPKETCQPYQVCSAGIQLDSYTGVSLVTKGCADLTWCQAMHGCNMQYMTCVHCCYGDLCNAAINNTMDYTTTTTWTAPPTTALPRSTSRSPQTTTPREMESCDLEPAAIYMTAHIVRLINFNYIPIQQRSPICQNFEPTLNSLIDDLECLEVTRGQVKVMADWLTEWTEAVCQQSEEDPVDEVRCHDSLACLENFGNFTNQNAACRMLNRTIGCLKTNSAFCSAPVEASINRSIQLLVDMDQVICEANPLDKYPEPPRCVDLQEVNNKSTCNATVALQCADNVERAVNNPFMAQEELCRLVKVGMQCMQDHTYNCSANAVILVAPKAAQLITLAQQACPGTWCPPGDTCRLDAARDCLDDLEVHANMVLEAGRADAEACMSVSKTYNCVVNSTEGCYALDQQPLTQRFHSLAQPIVTVCQAQANQASQCYMVYTEGVNTLVSMDQMAITNLVENLVTQILYNRFYGNQGQGAAPGSSGVDLPGGFGSNSGNQSTGGDGNFGYGVNLPGGFSGYSAQPSSNGWENPYIRHRRDTRPGQNETNNIHLENPGDNNNNNNGIHFDTGNKTNEPESPWSDKNSTSVPNNGNNQTRPGTNPNQELPTDMGPEMAQSGMGSDPWLEDLYRLMSSELSHMEYIEVLTSLVNISRRDVMALVSPGMLLEFGQHKLQLCDLVHDAYNCLNLHVHAMMLPGQQRHMLTSSLDLLAGVAMETCSPQECYSCSGLESNEQCNSQPLATCPPLQMCQVRTSGSYISKGCAPILTCEESCKHKRWNETCNCCHGNKCNEHAEKDHGRCEVQRAVGCVQHLLQMSVMGNLWQNSTAVYTTSMCMITSTAGCHSDAFRAIYEAGRQLMAMYEVANCSASYDAAFCSLPGAPTLVALASSPYQTLTSAEMTCRMFTSVLQAFSSNRTNTSCCPHAASIRLTLLSLYVQIEPFCLGLDIRPVCADRRSSGNCRTDSQGHETLEHVCTWFDLPERSNNGPRTCDMATAMDTCFSPLNTDPLSICPMSVSDLNTTRTCIAGLTNGCNSTQLAPVLSMMRVLVLTCPKELPNSVPQSGMSNEERQEKDEGSVLLCLQPLKNVTNMLSESNDLHAHLCGLTHNIDKCLKKVSHSALGHMMVPGLMAKLAHFNETFCHEGKDMDDLDQIEACRSEEIFECLVNPCDNVNLTTASSICANAVCLPDYCGGCNVRFFFRHQEVTDICLGVSQPNSCDVDTLSENLSTQLNYVMMSHMTGWYGREIYCSADLNTNALREEISTCLPMYSQPFSAMSSWLQDQRAHLCYSHAANTPCVQPRCDVAIATEIMDNMGYYLRTHSFDDHVFCQKVTNTLKGVECMVGACNETIRSSLESKMIDIAPVLHSRCPEYMRDSHCDEETRDHDSSATTIMPTSVRPPNTPTNTRPPNTRPGNTPVNTSRPRPTGQPGPQGSQPPPVTMAIPTTAQGPGGQGVRPGTSGSGGMPGPVGPRCDTEGAKMCLYSARLPAQNTSMQRDYCSNLLAGVERLSECVLSYVEDCDQDNVTSLMTYYSGILGRYQAGCSVNMTREFVRWVEQGECYIPECSYVESHNCLTRIMPDGGCGNLADVSDCVARVSAGCGPNMRYINRAMLRVGAAYALPPECWVNISAARTIGDGGGDNGSDGDDNRVDISSQPVLQCIEGMMNALEVYFSGNVTGRTNVCLMLQEFLGCLEASTENEHVPTGLSGAMKELVEHAIPILKMICQTIGNEEVEISYDDPASRCNLHQPLAILHSHLIDAIMGPVIPQDGKDYICGYDLEVESWRGGFAYLSSPCSVNQRQDLGLLFNLVEVFGRLTGMCAPHPNTCAPGEAVQCIQELAHTVRLHEAWETDQHHVCSSIHHTRLCLEQTTADCDQHVHASLMTTLEPVMCKALVVCPAAMSTPRSEMENHDKDNKDLPTCLSPADVPQEGGCSPNKALLCLQSAQFAAKKKDCREYAESMKCFMTNLGGCDEATAMVGLSYGIKMVAEVGRNCPTHIKAFCGREAHKGCAPDKIDQCFDVVLEATESGDRMKICYARDQAHHCLASHAGACPRLSQLFVKTQLLLHLSQDGAQNNLNDSSAGCNYPGQCAYNYAKYFSQSFEVLYATLIDNTGSGACSMAGPQMGMDNFECAARLGEVECMNDGVARLPNDVATLVTTSLQYTEALFSTTCQALNGITEELRGCNNTCLRCYMREISLQSYLPLLWTFASDQAWDENTTDVLYNEEFCSSYSQWSIDVSGLEADQSCYNGNSVVGDWHATYVGSMEQVYDKYCQRPCNVTQADECLAALQGTTGGDDPCLAYEAAQRCLNASIFYCSSDIRNSYTGLLDQVLIDAGFRCYQMPSFQASLSSSTLLEGVPVGLRVTLTGAMQDRCLGRDCQVEITLLLNDSHTTSCSSGDHNIQQILTDQCVVHFPTNTSAETQTFHLHTRIDHRVQPERNVTVTMVAQLLEDGEVFSDPITVGRVNMTVENRDTARLCSMIAQPTVVTFDGMEYISLGKGEYLVYENTDTDLSEKVNVRFQSCGGALTSCPCGVMVQSGDDVYVLDSCRRIGQDSQPLTFRVYRNGEYTPHTHVYYDTDGQATQFVLPSGSIVFVRSVDEEELDVWIHPSGLAWNNTLGLCGTFDGDANNDFTYPDLSVEAVSDVRRWRGALLPFDFLKTWKQDNTLMYGVAENDGYATRNNTLCQCTGSSDGLCELVDLVETCDFVSGVDYTDLLSVFEVDQDQSGQARRRKRQAVGEFDETEVTFDQLPQTPQTISEANAQQVCEDSITSAGFWDVCSTIVDTSGIIASCVDRVLLTDSYDTVGTTLDNLRVTCQLAILAEPGLSSTYLNMTYDTLVPYVLNVTCDGNCNGNGQCENGLCVCDPGFKGDNCALLQTNAPTLVSLSENLFTLTSASGNMAVTRSVEIYGNRFTNTDSLLCHTQDVEITSAGYTLTGSPTTQLATFKTVGTVQCEVTGTLPLSAVLVTVSNDGRNQSNGLLYIVQDEVCYDCDPVSGVCNVQPTSCIIDGACYGPADQNPADPCYICDPITNLWKYKPSATCTEDNATTTKRTTPTTTQNTTTPSGSTPSPTSPTLSPSSPTPSPSTPTPSPSSSPTPSSSPPSSTPSPTTTKSSSTQSSSSSSQTTPTPTVRPTSSPRPATTNSEGGSEGQGGNDDDDDDQTTLIIVISVAGVVVVVVFATVICIAVRLRKNDRGRMEESTTTSSSRTPSTQLVKAKRGDAQLQGRLNPYFQDVEFATAHGQDQPPIARRAAPTRAAPFNPQGLSDTRGYGPRPEPGSGEMYEINIGMFDGRQGAPGAKGVGGVSGASKNDPTHTWEEVGYKIPRPAVEAVYDTSAGRASPEKVRKSELEGMYTHL